MIKVVLSITGISIVLPHQGQPMKQVVFPAAKTPTNGVFTGSPIRAHLTYVLCSRAAYDGGRAPDLEVGKHYVFFLAGEEITMPKDIREPLAHNMKSIARIPDMNQLLSNAGKIDPRYANGKDPELLSARVVLRGGKLATKDPRPYDTTFRMWKTGKPVETMQLARYVTSEMSVEKGPFVLALENFATGKASEIRLKAISDNVQFVVANTPEDELLGQPGLDDYDADFELFYRAYDPRPQDPVFPAAPAKARKIKFKSMTPMGAGGHNCSPVRAS